MKTILLVLPLAFVAVVAVIAWSYWRFSAAIGGDVTRLLAAASRDSTIVTDEMLAPLPAPVHRYLAHAGVVGKPIPSVVRLTQIGRIRSAPEAGWMAFQAGETYSTDPPAFVWRAWVPGRSFPLVIGRDEYLEGSSSILMKMLAIYPIADERGDELVAAGLMRYLSEMIWFPAAFLGDNVTWRTIDDASAEVTITDRGISATATLFIDDEGRLTNFRAERHNTGTQSVETWETPITGYGEFAGLRLPATGDGVWKLADGDFTYINLEITDVAYDVPSR